MEASSFDEVDLCGFHGFLGGLIFYGIQRFYVIFGGFVNSWNPGARGRAGFGTLWQPVGRDYTGVLPLQESFVSLNPPGSKEQGARGKEQGARLDLTELPGLICIGFHRFSVDFIDFK